MEIINNFLLQSRILPVVTFKDSEDAIPTANALIDGGINAIEVTYRSSSASESIKKIKKQFPNMMVAAGTIKTNCQLQEAVESGADLIVSPHIDSKLIEIAKMINIPFIPGIQTATEIEMAEKLGLNLVKFFPAEYAGGTDIIKAWSSVFPKIKLLPTGGISISNMNEYLSQSNVLCVGGSWITNAELIENKSFSKIEELAKKSLGKVNATKVQYS